MTTATPTDPTRPYGGEREFVRTFTPLLEVRSASQGGDGRTIEGICVPYLREQRIDAGLTEQFVRGAFAHQLRAANRVQFSYQHIGQDQPGVLIGVGRELRETDDGLWASFRVSETAVGNDVLALVADRALTDLSIAFRERENFREANGTITRVRADLRHVAIVMEGAYGDGAQILAVRSAEQRGTTAWRPEPRRIDQVDALLAGMPALPDLPE